MHTIDRAYKMAYARIYPAECEQGILRPGLVIDDEVKDSIRSENGFTPTVQNVAGGHYNILWSSELWNGKSHPF